uniref:Uncharacterized protein n=1 Tax=Lactuca sativa TaxID=4236 RepID=A0A9R1XDG4_LACSA|nr:hypothetical protein LSAT_V11C500229830 [Lactuca sativa]
MISRESCLFDPLLISILRNGPPPSSLPSLHIFSTAAVLHSLLYCAASSSRGYMSSQESSKGNHIHADETINHDRAPSTLEEFKRLEEEKASQGVASQTVEKAEDGAMEAFAGDGSLESVKESFKESVGVGDFHRTGDT